MIFPLFRKKVVNIEPLKMQAENRLDITYTLRDYHPTLSFSPQESEIFITHKDLISSFFEIDFEIKTFSHKDFQNNFLFRKKTIDIGLLE